MHGPTGQRLAPHAVFTLNTIGDMNVPVNAGIAFARATGALPFMRVYPYPMGFPRVSNDFESITLAGVMDSLVFTCFQ